MNIDSNIEKAINDKNLNAPRLTPEYIENIFQSSVWQFHIFEGSQLTVCCLTLPNGFTVTGESACASPENFNQEIGETIALNNAKDKIWLLEGYLLKQRLNTPELTEF